MVDKNRLATIFIILVSISIFYIPNLSAGGITLLTQEQAGKFNISMDELYAIPKEKDIFSPGPAIIFIYPKVTFEESRPVINIVSPTKLTIAFIKNKNPIAMESLEVKVCKSFKCDSLNHLFQDYISDTDIQAENVQVPEGRYHVKIKIADEAGKITSENYLFQATSK